MQDTKKSIPIIQEKNIHKRNIMKIKNKKIKENKVVIGFKSDFDII